MCLCLREHYAVLLVCGVYNSESGESRGEVSPPELGSVHTHTHTLTGEVQQWLDEGKIQQHFLIYGL